jgi:hypothetical protein
MRSTGLVALVLAGITTGCGGGHGGAGGAGSGTVPETVASPLNDARPIPVYSGRTGQGLGISAEQPDLERLTVVLGWRGSCLPAGGRGHHQPLREARFDLDGVPGRLRDTKTEEGGDGDVTTFLRQIDVRRDGDAISGHFRIRSRLWNGQLRDVDSLCDTGRVSFSARPVATPRVQPLRVDAARLEEVRFQEQLARALDALRDAIDAGDPGLFCRSLTVRLRRTICPGGRIAHTQATSVLRSFGEPRSAERAGADGATMVLPTGGELFDGTNRVREVRELRFEAERPGAGLPPTWLLDRIGPVRRERVP